MTHGSLRVAVLGATGFVGPHVCDALAARGDQVLAVARRPPDRPGGHRFVPIDLGRSRPCDIAAVLDAERPAVVVNAVGSIWGRSDEEMWSATAEPVIRLLDAVALLSSRPRLVHLGSVLEHGPGGPGDTAGPAATTAPATAYGRAKLAATRAVLDRTATGEVDGMVLRVANVAGPGSPRVSLLGKVAERLVAAGPARAPVVIELDALLARRDYVDVRDVADAVVAAVDRPCSGAVVDIGRGEAIGVRELVQMLVDTSGVEARVVERGPRDPGRTSTDTSVDVRPARELLGWSPQRSPQDAVAAFWEDVVHRRMTPARDRGGI